MTWTAGLALGAAAGLGVAVPLGAIGVLLLQTGMTRGWRPAAAGALGVASVDLAYAVLAVLAGAAVSVGLAGHERAVRWAGGLLLAAVALRGLVGAWREVRRRGPDAGPVGEPGDVVGGPARAYLRFVALTAVNPLTVVAFTAVAAVLPRRVPGVAGQAAFVVGVAAASAAWQLALAGAGALLGACVTHGTRAALAAVGYGVVGALAVALLAG